MSTPPPNDKLNPAAPGPVEKPSRDTVEVKIVQHSTLFYWWPVWAVGFLMFLLTYFGGQRMLVVPPDAIIERSAENAYTVKVNEKPKADLEVGQSVPVKSGPYLHMAGQPYLGIIFAVTLLLVILITNVPLRGMWSVVVIVSFVMLFIILYLADWWQYVVNFFYFLNIHINAAGYLFIATIVFIIWAVTVFWFDQQIYILFTPGMMKVREEIGAGETAYDTSGMMIQHLRDDLFRHWILGLGSGDLLVRTSGAHTHEFRFNNVLFVGRKLQLIEEMQRDRPVITG